jgi:hypothetical protein
MIARLKFNAQAYRLLFITTSRIQYMYSRSLLLQRRLGLTRVLWVNLLTGGVQYMRCNTYVNLAVPRFPAGVDFLIQLCRRRRTINRLRLVASDGWTQGLNSHFGMTEMYAPEGYSQALAVW